MKENIKSMIEELELPNRNNRVYSEQALTKIINQWESVQDTMKHKEEVKKFMDILIDELYLRAETHDNSKLLSPELEIFAEYGPKLKDTTYMSDEYKTFLKEMQVALDHHYSKNRHHPEHYKNGIKDMDLIDIIEMFCDWKAASMRHNDGDIKESIKTNKERFNYDDLLENIFLNTLKYFDK